VVKIGDTIRTRHGEGKVTHILLSDDNNRYIILYKADGTPTYFVEGDERYKIIKHK
jgi:hypothetical protein